MHLLLLKIFGENLRHSILRVPMFLSASGASAAPACWLLTLRHRSASFCSCCYFFFFTSEHTRTYARTTLMHPSPWHSHCRSATLVAEKNTHENGSHRRWGCGRGLCRVCDKRMNFQFEGNEDWMKTGWLAMVAVISRQCNALMRDALFRGQHHHPPWIGAGFVLREGPLRGGPNRISLHTNSRFLSFSRGTGPIMQNSCTS